ncbi:LLM class flavin-dependent oxidoreductase [Actinomadura madurae]|nr:LLM class flavin-dependent oxidoreductase [Actinomadura madurae]MCP9981643.1 LLM class flavin-dependent oxidoreductase [Actinomadura madurae]
MVGRRQAHLVDRGAVRPRGAVLPAEERRGPGPSRTTGTACPSSTRGRPRRGVRSPRATPTAPSPSSPGPEDGAEIVKAIRAEAASHRRTVGVFTLGHVVCRPTRTEAEDFLRYYADEHADWPAVDEVMRLQGLHAQSFTPEMLQIYRDRFAAGHGSCPLIGDPDDVAEGIAEFARAGFDGIALSFLNYAEELGYFAAEVMPRLRARGVLSIDRRTDSPPGP